MSGKELFEGLNYVDERFVEEAEYQSFPKQSVILWIKIASMAACLCLIIFSVHQLWPHDAPEAAPGSAAPGSVEPGNAPVGVTPEIVTPGEIHAATAPEMMIRIEIITETGFVGTVKNNGGFSVFDDGTKITVTVDPETDPDYNPGDYKTGDLIYVMYTDWDTAEKTIIASILGIVEEPICD